MDRITRDRADLEDSDQGAKRQKVTPDTTSTASQRANMSSLTGKVFAITGGASGIGLATAKLLSSRGATVCIADVDGEAMKNAEAHFSGLGAKYDVTRVDVSKRAEVDAWIDGVVERHGRLDGAANVAGIIGREHGKTSTTELRDEEWDRIIAVNLTGTMYCLRAELKKIVDGGSIVNTSSIHGLKGEFALRINWCEGCD
jgi:NAD(P)-dependent dehydrogenase (short-subunit alcohol dehydrogenase family)